LTSQNHDTEFFKGCFEFGIKARENSQEEEKILGLSIAVDCAADLSKQMEAQLLPVLVECSEKILEPISENSLFENDMKLKSRMIVLKAWEEKYKNTSPFKMGQIKKILENITKHLKNHVLYLGTSEFSTYQNVFKSLIEITKNPNLYNQKMIEEIGENLVLIFLKHTTGEDRILNLSNCSYEALTQVSKKLIKKNDKQIESRMILLQAWEKKCKEEIDENHFPSEIILKNISSHVDDLLYNSKPLQFDNFKNTFESLAQITEKMRSYNERTIGSIAGNLALIFLIYSKEPKHIQMAENLFTNVLKYRLDLCAKKQKFPIEIDPSLPDLSIDPIDDLYLYCRCLKLIYKKTQKRLKIDHALIVEWMKFYRGKTLHQMTDGNPGINEQLTYLFQDLLARLPNEEAESEFKTSIMEVLIEATR
jgi:hypothetical protein